jgi:hypothetical protein
MKDYGFIYDGNAAEIGLGWLQNFHLKASG